VSEQSIYSWGKRYAGMVADAKKRPALEAENLRLKKLLAERDLELEGKASPYPVRGISRDF
jgi:putative transposase